MAEEPTPPEGEDTPSTPEPEKTHEETVPFERFQKVNQQAKEAKAAQAQLQKDMKELQAQMEERESAGLPELERMKNDMAKAQKRAEDAEKRAEEADKAVVRTQRERWVTAAALAQNFADPSDAAAFLNLDDVEDEKDAERAVKRLAGQKKHLLKAEEPQIPGRVLQNGQPAPANGGTNPALDEAQMLADGLKEYLKKKRQNV